jgi:hypothetical protein
MLLYCYDTKSDAADEYSDVMVDDDTVDVWIEIQKSLHIFEI